MAIITLQNLKDYLGITGASEDTRLQIIVDATNLSIDKYVGRTLAETEYENVYMDGTGIESLCLKNFPVSEIAEISIRDIVVDERDDTVFYGYGWYVKDPIGEDFISESGIVYNNGCWPRGRAIIKVTYTAGYPADAMPADIYFATLQMAAFYRNVTKKPGIASEWLGSYNVSLMNGLNQMNGELTIPDIAFKMVFDRYRVSYHSDIVY